MLNYSGHDHHELGVQALGHVMDAAIRSNKMLSRHGAVRAVLCGK